MSFGKVLSTVFSGENDKEAENVLKDIIRISQRFNLKGYEPSAYELHTLTSCYQLLKAMLKE